MEDFLQRTVPSEGEPTVMLVPPSMSEGPMGKLRGCRVPNNFRDKEGVSGVPTEYLQPPGSENKNLTFPPRRTLTLCFRTYWTYTFQDLTTPGERTSRIWLLDVVAFCNLSTKNYCDVILILSKFILFTFSRNYCDITLISMLNKSGGKSLNIYIFGIDSFY